MPRRNLFSLLVFLFLSIMGCGQSFQKTYGTGTSMQAFCVRQTSNGGYILCGNISLDSVNTDLCLIKTNAVGDILWMKRYGGPAGEYEGIVEQTNDGGYVLTGSTTSYGAGQGDIFVVRTDASGDTLWSRAFGGTGDEIGQYIQQTSDNGFVVGGHSDTFGPRGDFYLLRLNANGDTVWTRNYGGAKHDHGFCVQQTSDSGFILVGHSVSFGVSGGFGAVKTKSNGDTLWIRGYGGMLDSYCYSVREVNGGYLLAGTTQSFGAGGSDAMVIKINQAGDTVWARTYGTTGEEYFNCLKETPDGNFVLVGSTTGGIDSSNVFLVKIDANGDTLWTRSYGGAHDDEGMFVDVCADSGYVVAGLSTSFSGGISEMYLVKTDRDGNVDCLSHSSSVQMSRPDSVQYYVSANIGRPATQVQYVAVGYGTEGSTVTDVCATFGIPNATSKEVVVHLFPCPVVDILRIQSEIELGHIRIYDNTGRKCYEEKAFTQEVQVKMDRFTPGLYVVEAAGRHFRIVKE